ncbi:hypothetical protein DWQ65_05740 [Treponema phagedenis]|uniref:Small ribosomal subunit Rsm22 n=1 Tax=Treponema phagedenis TaxID=162 RepID=A0A0B7GQP0_TREPH|nr:small ribosomal subunit Rsm22 family protein [Treponema phagedenis]QSH99568.1 hypothetical protein DWQ65_05740 [Treponema phagedenis]CEM60904.1 conserved hypothetical protein [Treponema phagedenis]
MNTAFYERFIKKEKPKKKTEQKEKSKKSRAHTEPRLKQRETKKTPQLSKAPTAGFRQLRDNSIFSALRSDTKKLLADIPQIIESVIPLEQKHRRKLPQEIHQLFYELTSERSSRKIDYMNNPVKLSAYIHYYFWWNLVRLTKLLYALPLSLADNAVAADFGSGPLTLVCALWIARPELRHKKIIWYCADISAKALSIGEEIFLSLCAHTERGKTPAAEPWKIIKVNDRFGCSLKTKLDLFCAANMFNEIFWNTQDMEAEAQKTARTISALLKKEADILIIEPGIPLAGEFISCLRGELLEKNFLPVSPCPHNSDCVLPGQPALRERSAKPIAFDKWCHFTFTTEDSPANLLFLSEQANLGKERASLSFLFCTNKKQPAAAHTITARICSEQIKLPNNRYGRYACSEKGFLLILYEKKEPPAHKIPSGSLIQIPAEAFTKPPRDKKTGAFIIRE